MKILIFLIAVLGPSITTFAQTPQTRCTKTQPAFCVNERIVIDNNSKLITMIATETTVNLSGWSDNYPTSRLAKTTGCSRTTPRYCVDETIIIDNNTKKIVGHYADGTFALEGWSDKYPINRLAKTSGRGKTKPSFCVGETIMIDRNLKTITAYNPITKGYKLLGWSDDYPASRLLPTGTGTCHSSSTLSIDDLIVDLSNETRDVFETYNLMAKAVTKERSAFLKSLSKPIESLNSWHVNFMAGMLISKLVRLSTAQVIKDNFATSVTKYIEEMNKANWNSLMQTPANEETIVFAIQVIAAGVRLRNTQAGASPENEIRLKTLAMAAAKKGMVAKAIALREFLTSNMVLIEDLVADPRHGAIGSLVADTAQWVNKQFEE